MLILRITGFKAVVSVFQTDELPLPVMLESEDQRLLLPWFSPVYAQPTSFNDELSVTATTLVDDDYQFRPITWQASVYQLPLSVSDELSFVIDEDYNFTQLGYSSATFAQPLRDNDELGQPRILDEELYFPALSLAWKVYPQPVLDNDELTFIPLTIIDDDLGWTPVSWQATTFVQPPIDTAELAIPAILDDDPVWLPPAWQAICVHQPLSDNDELPVNLITIVDEDTWTQFACQITYFAQPFGAADEVSVAAVVDEEYWCQGFPRYLGFIAFPQPAIDDDGYHFIPPVITGGPLVVNCALSLIRLGGRVGW